MKISSLGLLLLQLLLIAGFIYHFNIEVAFNLPLLFPFVVGVFAVHSLLPSRYRKPVFIIATIIAIAIVLSLKEAFVLLAMAMGMIGICNIPIGLKWRKLILLAIAAVLVWLRLGHLNHWVTSPMLTILGSMFMFRMLLYLYEQKYEKKAVPLLTQISYFLMLPNVVFPLFPVVDYKTFQRQYYDVEALQNYQRGIYLIAKGILFLYLYRIIYSFYLPSQDDISTLTDLLQYMIWSYLLTIRLAGIFHFSVGVLHLFGWRLPDVFNNHFLADSFADLWRRINIYWKDFIIKLYFNPLYFKLKRFGTQKAVLLATLISFVFTLFYHQYQTFWITGIVSLRASDAVFWGFFGLSIALGTILPARKVASHNSFILACIHVSKILFTFLSMSLLWSFWMSTGLADWLNVISAVKVPSNELLTLIAITIGIILFGGFLKSNHQKFGDISRFFNEKTSRQFTLGFFLLMPLTFNSATLKSFWNQRIDGNDIHALFNLMIKDEEVHEEIAGYYDQILVSSDLMNPAVDDGVMWSKMFQVNLYQNKVVFKTNDAYKRRITPSLQLKIQGIDVVTNQYGMYDKDYALIPDDSTYRIAFLGASIEMGWAIPYDQGLEKVIERRLNKEWRKKEGINKVEILNYSVPSRSIMNHLYGLRHDVLQFQPDMVVLFDHDETDWVNLVDDFNEYDYSTSFDGYVDSVYTSGCISDQNLKDQLAVLEPYRKPLYKQFCSKIKDLCDSINCQTVYVEMPEINEKKYDLKYYHADIAAEAGFKKIDISSLFDNEEVSQFAMDAIGHPTLQGNLRLAEALYNPLVAVIEEQLQSTFHSEGQINSHE